MSDPGTVATASQTVGPFFHVGLRAERSGVAGPGERLRLALRVTDGDSRPVDDALLELWTSGEFVRTATGADGACEVEIGRERHINVCVFARGLLRQLHTRIYFASDPALEQDAVFRLVPEDRRNTLLACPDRTTPGRWMFDVRLQGSRETVFFDC